MIFAPKVLETDELSLNRTANLVIVVEGANEKHLLCWKITDISTDPQRSEVSGVRDEKGMHYKITFVPKSIGTGKIFIWIPGHNADASFDIEVHEAHPEEPDDRTTLIPEMDESTETLFDLDTNQERLDDLLDGKATTVLAIWAEDEPLGDDHEQALLGGLSRDEDEEWLRNNSPIENQIVEKKIW